MPKTIYDGLEPMARTIYGYVISQMGGTRVAACAILGNIQQESTFNPHLSDGDAYGLCQWTRSSGRRRRLMNYCKSKNLDYTSTMGQLQYLNYEVKNFYSKTWIGVNSYADNAGSVYAATEFWEKGFEAAGKPLMEKRKRYALHWWNHLSGQAVGATRGEQLINSGYQQQISEAKEINALKEGDITVKQCRKGSPSELKFTVMKDNVISFSEGDAVTLRINGDGLFAGYIFSKSRDSADKIDVTAYDQLRYLKNKDTAIWQNTYSGMVQAVCRIKQLKLGDIADTEFKLERQIYEESLFDMLQDASDETTLNTGKLYVLYDDFGKITLKNIEDMKTSIYIDDEVAESYDYKTSIDSGVYTRVKIAQDDGTSGTRQVKIYNLTNEQKKYGMLTFYEKLDAKTSTTINERVNTVLNYFSKINRTLTISGLPGDIRLRPGASIVVNLNIGDMSLHNRMLIENAEHEITQTEYHVNIQVSGIRGEFNAASS